MSKKKRNKYWNGPDGVYYDPSNDNIFIIEHTGARLYDFKRNKDMGGMFDFRARGIHHRNVAVIMSETAFRLGNL